MSRPRKLDINHATREDLMQVAGLRLAAADALMQHRKRVGHIADLEALVEVNGIGAITLERLRSHAEVAAHAPSEAGTPKAKAPPAPKAAAPKVPAKLVETIAETTRIGVAERANGSARTLDTAASVTETTADLAESAVRGLVTRVEEAAEAADRVIGAATTPTGSLGGELGTLWLATVNAQVEDGVATLKGLVAARNVNAMVELQARFVSQSVGRIADFQSRSLAVIGKATSGITGR